MEERAQAKQKYGMSLQVTYKKSWVVTIEEEGQASGREEVIWR